MRQRQCTHTFHIYHLNIDLNKLKKNLTKAKYQTQK